MSLPENDFLSASLESITAKQGLFVRNIESLLWRYLVSEYEDFVVIKCELHLENFCFLHMQKQKRRSAARFRAADQHLVLTT